MNGDDTHLAAAINETPKRGPFSFSADTKRTWQCPFCDHTLRYSPATREVAELGANSHVNRQHKGEKLIVILPDDAPLSRAGAISVIWQCPFCDVTLKVSDDEHQRSLEVQGHLVEKHRYHEQQTLVECQVPGLSPQSWRNRRRRNRPATRRWGQW